MTVANQAHLAVEHGGIVLAVLQSAHEIKLLDGNDNDTICVCKLTVGTLNTQHQRSSAVINTLYNECSNGLISFQCFAALTISTFVCIE